MIRFVGLDLHKRLLVGCILDEQGNVLREFKFTDMTPGGLALFLRHHLDAEDHVALEATTNVWAVVRLLRPLVAQVVVSNPVLTKAIALAKVKTDKVDACVLAHLLRCRYLPEVWQPDAKTQVEREWTARRSRLVSHTVAITNRIRTTLAQQLLDCPHAIDSKSGRQWLADVSLDNDARWLIDSDLRLLDAVLAELDAIDARLAVRGYADPRIKLLMTLPGVSQHTAQSLLAAIGDVERFRDAKALASYLGLVPSTRQSANKCYHGSITKSGRSHTRWMLVQAAQSVRQHPGPLGHFLRRLKRKKNHNVAVVAVAHKLAMLAWYVLKSGEPYRYALPRATEDKLAKLRVRATGERRRGGVAKGVNPRHVHSAGNKGRTQRSLPDVYASEGLPQASVPPQGELKVLETCGVQEFFGRLTESSVEPRKRSTDAPADGPGTLRRAPGPAGSRPAASRSRTAAISKKTN